MIGAICGTIGIFVGTVAGMALCDASHANQYDDTDRGRRRLETDAQLGIYPFDWYHQKEEHPTYRKEPC